MKTVSGIAHNYVIKNSHFRTTKANNMQGLRAASGRLNGALQRRVRSSVRKMPPKAMLG